MGLLGFRLVNGITVTSPLQSPDPLQCGSELCIVTRLSFPGSAFTMKAANIPSTRDRGMEFADQTSGLIRHHPVRQEWLGIVWCVSHVLFLCILLSRTLFSLSEMNPTSNLCQSTSNQPAPYGTFV